MPPDDEKTHSTEPVDLRELKRIRTGTSQFGRFADPFDDGPYQRGPRILVALVVFFALLGVYALAKRSPQRTPPPARVAQQAGTSAPSTAAPTLRRPVETPAIPAKPSMPERKAPLVQAPAKAPAPQQPSGQIAHNQWKREKEQALAKAEAHKDAEIARKEKLNAEEARAKRLREAEEEKEKQRKLREFRKKEERDKKERERKKRSRKIWGRERKEEPTFVPSQK